MTTPTQTQIALTYPVGRTPDALYFWAQKTVDTLKAALNESAADPETAIEAVELAISDIEQQLDGGIPIPALTAAVDNALGVINAEVQDSIAQSEAAAAAAIQALMTAQTNAVNITVEQAARLQADEAFTAQLTTLNSTLADTTARIATEETARATGDNAVTSQVTTLQSTVAANTAQVQVITATVDGIKTKFAVTLNSNGDVTGLIQLDGTSAGTTFTVVADKFLVAQRNLSGGAPKAVFAIAPVNGVNALALKGDLLADGAIVARTVAANAITADKIDVAQLSAIVANLGTIIAGLLRDASDTARFDVPSQKWYQTRANGSFIDLKNGRLLFVGS